MLRGLVLDFGGVLTDFGDDYVVEPPLLTVVREVRKHGILTGLLSNADGLWAPPTEWTGLFDAVVISGEVGLAKPSTAIYRLTADHLHLTTDECVFVDDLAINVRGAAAAGMVGVHHTSIPTTIAELAVLLGFPLLP
ncbi:HAD-IA family hydrolase [Umezawaea endophytica]|uniref:HAD-IA family hydrolase n=1 Tax=Umezawaea endophytica TaxID=1654476 RepID=A0A9X2VRV1_9PSEU|nr:HAD-IA family hydrolase [Umezawaea endophytica]MCS7481671.1 HAD-IA family hydrolase [Umezawaea endophytica]